MAMFTPEMTRWLASNVPGKTFREITAAFNGRFNTAFTLLQVKGHCHHFQIRNYNRARPREHFHKTGAEKQYKGMIYVKVSCESKGYRQFNAAGTWRQKHYIVWEAANGSMPKGHDVIFADGNKRNFNIDNLLLVSRREFLCMSRAKMYSSDPDVTKTNLLIVRHRLAILDRVNGLVKSKGIVSLERKVKMLSSKQRIWEGGQ